MWIVSDVSQAPDALQRLVEIAQIAGELAPAERERWLRCLGLLGGEM